jgi:dTDP-4-dehydrorhamnose reductase
MRVVLTGASGQLGSYLANALQAAGHKVFAWSGASTGTRSGLPLQSVPLSDPSAVEQALNAHQPDVVLHAAAVSKPALVLRDPTLAWHVNVEATRVIAGWCRTHERRLLFTSTDLVFDGARGWYQECDRPNPLVEYARTKVAAEEAVLDTPRGLAARMSLMFGPSLQGGVTYFDTCLQNLRLGTTQSFFYDEFRTPLDYESAAHILTQLVEAEVCGLLHVGGMQRLSRFELMSCIAGALGINPSLVGANSLYDTPGAEPRPADVSLNTELLASALPGCRRFTVEDAVSRWRFE